MSEINVNPEVIEAFHMCWDAFPGAVRLIDKAHRILASNNCAKEKGFLPGVYCATIGEPCSHKGCKSAKMIKTKTAQTDRPTYDRIRGWIPLQGYPDIYVHYTLELPEVNE